MYAEDIKKLTKENTHFRKVLHTGQKSQIVAMCIPVGENIGEETHPETDQILFFVEGEGVAILNNEIKKVEKHDVVFVPAGTKHNFFNRGEQNLKLFTIYAPPEHAEGTVQATKEEAHAEEKKFKK